MAETTKHYLISGRVQGVGFRVFVQRNAQELQLRGWVRNLLDGRVEALVQGTETSVLDLESRIKSGPAHSRVETVQVQVVAELDRQDLFAVRKDSSSPWEQE